MEPGTLVLRDIHGLDAIPWWPLAPGWWYLLGLVGLLVLLALLREWMIYSGIWLGWRADARRQLRALKKALRTEDPRVLAGRLSELLRRIAMARSGRREAAGLTGNDWLQWLNANDSSRFDWEERGQMLLTAPYMPPAMEVQRKELAALISATGRLIDAKDPASRRTGLLQRLQLWLPGRSGGARV